MNKPIRVGLTTAKKTDDTGNIQSRLPDPKICQTKYLGQALDFSKCLVENPEACKYAVGFSGGVICDHPHRRWFEKPELAKFGERRTRELREAGLTPEEALDFIENTPIKNLDVERLRRLTQRKEVRERQS